MNRSTKHDVALIDGVAGSRKPAAVRAPASIIANDGRKLLVIAPTNSPVDDHAKTI